MLGGARGFTYVAIHPLPLCSWGGQLIATASRCYTKVFVRLILVAQCDGVGSVSQQSGPVWFMQWYLHLISTMPSYIRSAYASNRAGETGQGL